MKNDPARLKLEDGECLISMMQISEHVEGTTFEGYCQYYLQAVLTCTVWLVLSPSSLESRLSDENKGDAEA